MAKQDRYIPKNEILIDFLKNDEAKEAIVGNPTLISIEDVDDIIERVLKQKPKIKPFEWISVGTPNELEPVLAQIEHINDLGKSKWYEVVYFDGAWQSYNGSKAFKDGEIVVKWTYIPE